MERKNVPDKIIVHHSASPRDTTTVAMINEWHKERGFPLSQKGYYVGYHVVIDGAGNVTKTRDYDEEGAHTIGQNFTSIGICLTGNYDEEVPSKKQKIALSTLLFELGQLYKISPANIFPHRTFAAKSCYGTLLADDWARGLVLKFTNENLQINDKKTNMENTKPALYEIINKTTGEIKIVVPHTFGDGFVLFSPVIDVTRSEDESTFIRFENPGKDGHDLANEFFTLVEVK